MDKEACINMNGLRGWFRMRMCTHFSSQSFPPTRWVYREVRWAMHRRCQRRKGKVRSLRHARAASGVKGRASSSRVHPRRRNRGGHQQKIIHVGMCLILKRRITSLWLWGVSEQMHAIFSTHLTTSSRFSSCWQKQLAPHDHFYYF